jgi:hypothetical protein
MERARDERAGDPARSQRCDIRFAADPARREDGAAFGAAHERLQRGKIGPLTHADAVERHQDQPIRPELDIALDLRRAEEATAAIVEREDDARAP